jgi:hypothetical protein
VAAGCHSELVTPSDDLSPPRRPIFFPVVIATVFLTIIGMTAGFLLGERHRQQVRTAAEQSPDPGADPVSSSAPGPTPSGARCPLEAEQTATRQQSKIIDLYEVLQVHTDNQATVWICRDADDRLYYQSKTGGLDAPLVEGENGLFLPGVVELGSGQFQAIADDGNRFVVDRSALVIHFAKTGKTESHKVQSD